MENIFTEAFVRLLIEASAISLPVVELIKRLIRLKGIGAVILSLIVSVAIGIPFGFANQLTGFTLIVFVGSVFAIINGWYKIPKKKE